MRVTAIDLACIACVLVACSREAPDSDGTRDAATDASEQETMVSPLDEARRAIAAGAEAIDTTGDGKADLFRTFDTTGQLTREEMDVDDDGVSELFWTYTANEIVFQRDLDHDGRFEEERRTVLRVATPLRLANTRTVDTDDDGHADLRTSYEVSEGDVDVVMSTQLPAGFGGHWYTARTQKVAKAQDQLVPSGVAWDNTPDTGCSDEDRRRIVAAHGIAVHEGLGCLQRHAPGLAGELRHVVTHHVLHVSCPERIPAANGRYADARTPDALLYPIWREGSPVHMSISRDSIVAPNVPLESLIFHELLHNTGHLHASDDPMFINDPVYACQALCFGPHPNRPLPRDDGRDRTLCNSRGESYRPPYEVTSFWGDPHIRAWGGASYDFMGHGEFVLAEDGSHLLVQARLEPVAGSRRASVATAIATKLGAQRVVVHRGRPARVTVDGAPLAADSALARDELITVDGDMVAVRLSETDVLLVRTHASFLDAQLRVAMSPTRPRMRGILGRSDGVLATRNDTPLPAPLTFAALYPSYADGWRITREESLFDYEPGQTTATFTDVTFPDPGDPLAGVPAEKLAEAEATCRKAGANDPAVVRMCTLDVAVTGDAQYAEWVSWEHGIVPKAEDGGPPSACATRRSCDDCNAVASCGWCQAERRCTSSSERATCREAEVGSWRDSLSACFEDCGTLARCAACVDNPFCGWLPREQRCTNELWTATVRSCSP